VEKDMSRLALSRVLAPLVLTACLPWHKPAVSSATLTCHGPPATPEVGYTQVTPGPALVSLVSGTAPNWQFWEVLYGAGASTSTGQTNAWGVVETQTQTPEQRVADWYASQVSHLRVKVSTEGALLGSLAAALSDATGLNILVQEDMIDLPVSLGIGDATVAQLQTALLRGYGVSSSFEQGVVYWSSSSARLARNGSTASSPVETALLWAPEGVEPIELAHAICATSAGPTGSAAVLGEQVLVRDEAHRVAQARELVRVLEEQWADEEE